MTGGGWRSPPDGRSTGGGLEGGSSLRSRSARSFPLKISPLPTPPVGLSTGGMDVDSVQPTGSVLEVVAGLTTTLELAGGISSDLPSAIPAGCGHLSSSVPCSSDVMLTSTHSMHGGDPAVVMDVTSGLVEAVVSFPELISSRLCSDLHAADLHASSVEASLSPLVSREISDSLSRELSGEFPPATSNVFKFQESLLGTPGCPVAQSSLFSPIGQHPMDSLEAVKGFQFSAAGCIPRFDAQRSSNVTATTSRVIDPMVTTSSQAVPNVKAWGKPLLCRLPAKELNDDGVVRGDRVQLDVADVEATSKRFESALVGRLFGRRFNFETLNSELHRRWAVFGGFKLVMVSGDCFICFFSSLEGCVAVLLGGPWLIAGQVIGLDRWLPDFTPTSKAGFVTHVWVRFPSLPMYCWGAKNIVRIAGLLGDPIYMDAATEKLDRGNYARVCIRMDLSLPLRAGLWIDGPHGSFHQAVEYEGLPRCCFKCGLVGHRSEWCTACLPSPPTVVAKPPVSVEVGIGPAVLMDEGVAVVNMSAGGYRTGVDSGQVVNGVSGSSVSVPSAEIVPGAPDGLGPWMLVSYKRKPPRPAVDRHLPPGSWEREKKEQWQLKNKLNAAGSGGRKIKNGDHALQVGARGKDKLRSSPTSSVPPITRPMDVTVGNGMDSEDFADKRVLKRKKDTTLDGGDASSVGI